MIASCCSDRTNPGDPEISSALCRPHGSARRPGQGRSRSTRHKSVRGTKRRLAPAPRTVRHDRHPHLRRRRPLRPGELQRQAPPGAQGRPLRSRAPFHPGPAARWADLQGPPRRAHHAAAHRPGLRRRRARHPRPRHRHPGRARPPVHHLRGHRVGHRRRQGVPRRRPDLPLAAPQRPPQGRGRLAAAAPPRRAAGAAQPPLRRRVHLRPDHPAGPARREELLPAAAPRPVDLLHPRAPTPATPPWASTRPTSPSWRPTPPRTDATAPPDRPAKAPRCCRASSSADAAGCG
jgi:hypothetical protein